MVFNGVALIALALLLGGMAFFAAVVAPLVFTKLPAEHSGRFIRQVFPVYYLWVGATAAVAALALAPVRAWDALAMAGVAAVTVWLRQGLMPRINRMSDAARGGDGAAARGFGRGHRASVVVNLGQIVVAGAVLLRLA